MTTNKGWRVAVLGATGLVGESIIKVLEERNFPVSELYPLASDRSIGKDISFRDKRQPVLDADTFDYSRADIALCAAGEAIARVQVPKAAAAGCTVIDTSSEYRYQEDVPLVVPEVNPGALAGFRKRGIVASPGPTTVQLLVVLKPLHDAAVLERISVATYQSVSGVGRAGVNELAEQSVALMSGRSAVRPKAVAAQIAFNAVPHIEDFTDDGYTREEMKLVWETHKILGDARIRVGATAVRVPVFFGHSVVVGVETQRKLRAAEARTLLQAAPGVEVLDQRRAGGYPTPVQAANQDTVYVGRIREDMSHDRGLALWVVADNVRRGAAINSIQIAEILVRDHL